MLKFALLFLTALIHISTECNIIDYSVHPPAPYRVAVETCAMKGSQLILPINADEVFFLKESSAWGQPNWIGIHAMFDGQEFVDINRDRFTENEILHWEIGFPDSARGYCGNMRLDGIGNEDCNNNHRFVCKKVSFSRSVVVFPALTFKDAVINCALSGGQLLNLQSSEEFIEIMLFVVATRNTIWLGIHDKFEEGNFINLNGESVFPSEFLQWAPGSPTLNSTNNCVELRRDRLIYDVPCDNSNVYLCNMPRHNNTYLTNHIDAMHHL